jgi:hypothetical protein
MEEFHLERMEEASIAASSQQQPVGLIKGVAASCLM